MAQADVLLKSLEQYEAQLLQIRQAIDTASGTSKEDLYVLEKDIEELISLTKETLNSLGQSVEDPTPNSEPPIDSFSQEYALFKAELAELEGKSVTDSSNSKDNEAEKSIGCSISQELQDDLNALKGSKCQAPYKQNWGDESYYNALIMDIETKDSIEDLNHIQVRVMYVNPTEKVMLPCPYYLDGECRFTDDKCHFSHGELVPLSNIREYREPDFSSLKVGSHVMAKQKDNLWHHAKVKDILNNSRCIVKFESKGCETVELDMHDLLPLESKNNNDDDDDDEDESDSEDDDVVPQDYFVQLSLSRTPPNVALGAWEKHTKGIGSRLMANMGYVVGCGLGKYGEGRLEPVEAVAYPPGKSIDACIALREAGDGDNNFFKAMHRQKKQQRQLLRVQRQQQMKQNEKKDLFSFINSKLAGNVASKADCAQHTTLASSSRKVLNVEMFRLGENIKKIEKDVEKLKQSLKRHDEGSLTHNTINSKLRDAQTELHKLQSSEQLVVKEQNQRAGRKKITVF